MQPHPARLLFRFGIGLAELVGEQLSSALRTVNTLSSQEVCIPMSPADPAIRVPDSAVDVSVSLRHVTIGTIAMTPRLFIRSLGPLAAMEARTRQLVRRWRRLADLAPGAAFVRKQCDGLWQRAHTLLGRCAAEGRREETLGRKLAEVSLAGFFEASLARVAESPDLKRVIEEQSEGVAVAAVTELRERSRSADGLVEAFARRLVRLRASRSA